MIDYQTNQIRQKITEVITERGEEERKNSKTSKRKSNLSVRK